MKIRLAVGFVVAVLFGCSGKNSNDGSQTGSATLTGTIKSEPFAPSDAISVNVALSTPPGNGGAVTITSQAGLCGRISGGQDSKSVQYLILVMGDFNATTGMSAAPTAAGTYTIYSPGSTSRPPRFAGAVYSRTDANCNVVITSNATATSGTVTITSVNGDIYSGNFDLILNFQDHITGTFTTGHCAALAGVFNLTAQLQCR